MARLGKYVGILGLSESRDQALLALAFIIGAAGIVVFKTLGMPNYFVILLTLFVLFAYATAMWRSKRTKIEPETIGDNCYYLGFLFTLTSLGVVLFQIGEPGRDDLHNVISGFGLALASTIYGVFLRVLFMQARHDLVAHDVETRRDLLSATRDFRASLALSTSEVKAFTVEVTQLASETVHRLIEVSKEADAIQRTAAEKAAALQMATAERVAATERSTSEKVAIIHQEAAERAASVSMAAIEARLSLGASVLQDAIRDAATAATRESAQAVGREIERGADFFKKQYETLSTELERQAADIRATFEALLVLRAQGAEQMATVTTQVEAVARAAVSAGSALGHMEPGLRAANTAISEGLTEATSKLYEALAKLAEEADTTRAALVRLRESSVSPRESGNLRNRWRNFLRRAS